METLKRKKMYEQQRDQMAGQQFNIEQTSFAIDSVKDTATTVRYRDSGPPFIISFSFASYQWSKVPCGAFREPDSGGCKGLPSCYFCTAVLETRTVFIRWSIVVFGLRDRVSRGRGLSARCPFVFVPRAGCRYEGRQQDPQKRY